jgi:hypothetical protein
MLHRWYSAKSAGEEGRNEIAEGVLHITLKIAV